MNPNFIGIGAEKAGTSWVFACLYEHPEICIPIKEINFFADDKLWKKGQSWYENIFRSRCSDELVRGEFSTEYLSCPYSPSRINLLYPKVIILVCLRNPIERAFSNYRNEIMAGTISVTSTFSEALLQRPNYLNNGKYKMLLQQYFDLFTINQLHIYLYDDLKSNPLKFIQSIYKSLGVDSTFIPPSLHKRINESRIPKSTIVEKVVNIVAATLQKSKLGGKIWWKIKNSHIPSLLRKINSNSNEPILSATEYNDLIPSFIEDIKYVEELLNRKLSWAHEK